MLPGTVIADCFEVTGKLGGGAFGDVYGGIDTRTSARVAIKVESVDTSCPQLVYEARVIAELQDCPGIPRKYWFGRHEASNVLVMQKLGACLIDTKVTLENVAGIARQCLERLQSLHFAGFAHRDVKPENFMYGHGRHKTVLYIIDFGLCKRVVDVSSGRHIDNRRGKALTGTPRYASLFTHDGNEQSRRDDIEALVYTLIFMVRGSLPWQGLSSESNYAEVAQRKRDISVSVLCNGLPPAFEQTLRYARSLPFTAMPDYTTLSNIWSSP